MRQPCRKNDTGPLSSHRGCLCPRPPAPPSLRWGHLFVKVEGRVTPCATYGGPLLQWGHLVVEVEGCGATQGWTLMCFKLQHKAEQLRGCEVSWMQRHAALAHRWSVEVSPDGPFAWMLTTAQNVEVSVRFGVWALCAHVGCSRTHKNDRRVATAVAPAASVDALRQTVRS